MPTTDEHRDVAARLREQKPWDIFTDFEDCIGDLCAAVFDDEGDLNDMFRLQAALADLIEPEERTCRIEKWPLGMHADDGYADICSNCRVAIERDFYYCPNCGAKVASE